jgi:hypothetical protein
MYTASICLRCLLAGMLLRLCTLIVVCPLTCLREVSVVLGCADRSIRVLKVRRALCVFVSVLMQLSA